MHDGSFASVASGVWAFAFVVTDPPMPFPALSRARTRCSFLLLLLAAGIAQARGPEPVARIDLRALGYQDFPSQMLDTGAALLTTHYVDEHHLLLTFSRRRLLARIPDDPPDDFDRNLDAMLLEVPSGKLVARTSWRAHDIGQYLWSLGNGSFLLRQRNRLVTISPMRSLGAGSEAFREHPLLTSTRPIGALFVSADGKLLTVETLDRKAAEGERSPSPRTRAYAAAAAEEAQAKSDPDPVQVNFFRMLVHPETGLPLAQSAGGVRSPSLIMVPVDAAGYLATVDQGKHHYAFDFHQHTGKTEELSPFDSTCQPAPILVSRSEFIALGCRSGTQLQMMGGFNLHGEEMWEQVLPEAYVNPTFSFAPAAGRFAFGRVVTSSMMEDGKTDALSRNLGVMPSTSGPVAAQIQSQTVNVFQMESGRLVFTMTAAPVLRAGGNFALSPDGSELAVVRNGTVEVYRLPPPSGKERAALKLASTYAPEPNEAPIHLNGHAAVALPTATAEQRTAGVAPAAAAASGAGHAAAGSQQEAGSSAGAQAGGNRRDGAMTSAASEEPSGSETAVAVENSPGTGKGATAAPAGKAATREVEQGDPVEGERRKVPSLYGPDEKQTSPATDTPRTKPN